MTTDVVKENNQTSFFGVQLFSVTIHRSNFNELSEDEIESQENSLSMGLKINVEPDEIEAHLSMTVENRFPNDDGSCLGFDSYFCVKGMFRHSGVSRDDLKVFSYNVIFPTLLPYAREYHGDIARRVGYPYAPIPMVNPQAVVADMQKRDGIEIDFEEFDSFQE